MGLGNNDFEPVFITATDRAAGARVAAVTGFKSSSQHQERHTNSSLLSGDEEQVNKYYGKIWKFVFVGILVCAIMFCCAFFLQTWLALGQLSRTNELNNQLLRQIQTELQIKFPKTSGSPHPKRLPTDPVSMLKEILDRNLTITPVYATEALELEFCYNHFESTLKFYDTLSDEQILDEFIAYGRPNKREAKKSVALLALRKYHPEVLEAVIINPDDWFAEFPPGCA